ncbi:MAG: hypothetical protein JWO38_7547 [Gemmataceae bacterium]|nr:hypothetical protein [Gemmataceae bacterium]
MNPIPDSNPERTMYRTAAAVAAALILTGCTGDPKPLPMAATAESSRAVLVAALDGWKQSRTFQELVDQSPSLYFLDDEMKRGSKLLDYKIEGDGRPLGTGYSYVVTLTIHDRDGAKPPTRKKVAYTAVTEPKNVVSLEDRTP